MEKQLKCHLLLPLKEMALRKVVASFWSDPDFLSSAKKFESNRFSPFADRNWINEVKNLIKEKIAKLLLPTPLIKQLIALIYPFSLEVRKWKRIHACFLISIFDVPSRLCWTTAGTIDYRKTAEKLISCNKLNGETRYELACCYCLENDISHFWEALPEEAKEKYCNYEHLWPYLPYWWPFIHQGKQFELDQLFRTSDGIPTSFNQRAFEYCARVHCKAASEYFLQKLTPEERETSLFKSFHAVIENRNVPDLLFFLLSAMTPQQQLETVKAHPVKVLYCFLQWPLQDLFLENADFFWTFLPPSSYIVLIMKIIIGYERSDFYFPKMFKEFFMHSPQEFKKSFMETKWEVLYPSDTAADYLLKDFIRKEDSESIKVLFRSLDASDRVKIVFHDIIFKRIYQRVAEERYQLVELCLREATLPKNERQRMKEAFSRLIEERNNEVKRKFKTIFDFLDNIDASSYELRGEKRKLENCSSEQ